MNQTWKIIVAVIVTAVVVGGGFYYYQNAKTSPSQTPVSKSNDDNELSPIASKPAIQPKKEAIVWKLFDPETAYGAGSEFDVQYPSDWHEIELRGRNALAYREWPADADSCLITLGVGGSGVGEGDTNITVDSSSQNYGDLPATKKVFKQNGLILKEVTSFSRDNIDYLFELQTKSGSDYDKCKRDYENILATFRFL
ncbi:MAG: hypothetical protein Q7S48_05210 [bacterium]|nr:hypothetical protein [bacterium]